jgi:uncharacterized integral membrane protein
MRYYSASVKDEIRKSQRWRLLSILFALISFELFLFFLVINVTFPLPADFGWMNLPLGIVILFAIYRFIAYFIEKRMLSFYAHKKLILKKHIEPIVSKMFTLVMYVSYIAVLISHSFLIAKIIFSRGFSGNLHNLLFIVTLSKIKEVDKSLNLMLIHKFRVRARISFNALMRVEPDLSRSQKY